MPNLRLLTAALAAAVVALGAVSARAQDFPNKPVRIVTGGAGGGLDIAARQLAQGISGGLGQPVIVENRPTNVIAEVGAKAPPDGYTTLVHSAGLWLFPFMANVNYDAVRDFAPITLLLRLTNVLVVHPSLPVKSVKELIALAKARPGELNFAHGGAGVSSHLAGELFKHMAGVNIVPIAFGSTTQGSETTALLSGEVQMTFGGAGVAEYIKSGRLRALAVTSLKPSPLHPNLPTIAATVPGYASGSTYGFFAPSRTPDAAIKRLNQEAVRFLNTAEAKERFLRSGLETVGSSPEEFAAAIKAEMASMGKVIKDAGIRAQ